MSDFTRKVATLPGPPPDPAKRVNYTHGLVLGVDEFTQESAYLSGRTEWLTRELLGYGTVSGLRVQVPGNADAAKGSQIVVAAGTAVSPSGRLIRVTAAQHALVDAWLGSHAQEVSNRADLIPGSPPSDSIAAYVVLCYRQLPDDDRPVAGERCRTDDGPTVPSRIRDDFHLQLRFDPPDQREDDASSRFVHWLTQVEITDAGNDFVTLDDFLAEIRRASPFPIADPGSPSLASPPQAIRVRPRDACEYMDAAFRVWTTELRPLRMRPSPGALDCAAAASDDDCVLLAALDIPVVRSSEGWLVDRRATIAINETQRPYLVHLRALQQWLLCSAERWSELDGDVTGPAGRTTVERLRHIPIAASPPPADRQVLTFDGATGQWRPDHPVADSELVAEMTFGQPSDPGDSTSFSRADHTHGTPALTGDVTVDPQGSTVVGGIQTIPVSATRPTANQMLTFDGRRWRPAALTGDVTVNPQGSTVVGSIQSIPVFARGATGGQVLTFVTGATGAWMPADLPASTLDPSAIAFGQTGAAGISGSFSRADHRHATAPLPALGGDVTGAIGANVVTTIQGVSITATGATGGQVLTFTAGAWQPEDPGTLAGPFVEHPDALPRYRIVAAGIIQPFVATDVSTTYNGLRFVPSNDDGRIPLTFDGYKRPPGDPPYRYIVKILPMSEPPVEWFFRVRDPFDAKDFSVLVTKGGAAVPIGELEKLKLMVEVSQYFLSR